MFRNNQNNLHKINLPDSLITAWKNFEKCYEKFNWSKICIFVFFATVFTLYTLTSYIYSYDVLYDHDLAYGIGRSFIFPEHGRYIATFMNSLFSERLPVLFNFHPNVFNELVTSHFKSFLVLLLVFFLTASAFLFKKREKSLLSTLFTNYASVVFLISMFVILISNQYFLSYEFMQNTVFFEYPMSFLPYIPFWSIIIFLYTKNIKSLNKKTIFLLFSLCFFLGISIEEINLASLVSLGVLSLIMFIRRNDFQLQKKHLFFILSLNLVYIISLFLYYVKGNDSVPNYGSLSFFEYVQNIFPLFLKHFFEFFIIRDSKLLIPVLIVLSLIFLFSKEKESRNFISIILINIFSFIVYHFMTFFMGYFTPGSFEGIFYVAYPKFIMLYKISLIFYLLVSIGYLVDEVLKLSSKQQDLLKIIICLIPMLFLNKFPNFINNIKPFVNEQKEYRKYSYIAEKIALQQINGEELILPLELKDKTLRFASTEEWLLYYYSFIHPKEFSAVKKLTFSENKQINMNIFSEKELKEIKFQNLLNYPMKIKEKNWY